MQIVTLMSVHVSSKKMWLYRHPAYHLKAHRITTCAKITCKEVWGKVMAITKIVITFNG